MEKSKCCCESCGAYHNSDMFAKPREQCVFGYILRLCNMCGQLDPKDRETLMAIWAKKNTNRPYTKRQEQWINQHPEFGAYYK